MIVKPFLIGMTAGIAAVFAFASQAQAAVGPNLVSNGDFESNIGFNTQINGPGSINPNAVTDWTSPSATGYNILFNGATATTVDAVSAWPGEEQRLSFENYVPSPNGGYFVALDGAADARGPFQQTISGLTAGHAYRLSFEWAATQLSNRVGPTDQFLTANFGGVTQATNMVSIPTHGFAGWFNQSFNFRATSATETLTFLSVGTPDGLPPVVLLDNVSLGAVPEPQTWAMLVVGFGMVGATVRRRRTVVTTAA